MMRKESGLSGNEKGQVRNEVIRHLHTLKSQTTVSLLCLFYSS